MSKCREAYEKQYGEVSTRQFSGCICVASRMERSNEERCKDL